MDSNDVYKEMKIVGLVFFILLIIASVISYTDIISDVISLEKFIVGMILSTLFVVSFVFLFFYASRKNFIFFFEGFESKKKMILIIFGFFINWMFLFSYLQSNETINMYYVSGFILGLIGLLIFFILYDIKPVRKNKKFDKKSKLVIGSRSVSVILIVYSLYYLFIYDLKALLLALAYIFGFLFSSIV